MPFEAGRFAGSLRRALAGDGRLADDLTHVACAWLVRPEQGPMVGQGELGRLAARLLESAGAGWAAERFREPRRPAVQAPRPEPRTRHQALSALADGAGPAAEGQLARHLLAAEVRGTLLGEAVLLAEAQGLLDVTGGLGGARVPGATLPTTWLDTHRGPELGATLRRLVRLVLGELRLPWSGRPLGAHELRSLARHLVDAGGGTLVLMLPGAQASRLGVLKHALDDRGGRTLVLRFLGELPAGVSLPDDPRIQWAPCAPPPGTDLASATLHLPAVIRAAGGRTAAALALVEELAEEALGALASVVAAGPGATARQELSLHTGDHGVLVLCLAGVFDGAPATPSGPDSTELSSPEGHTPDVLASLGERLRRVLGHARLPSELALSPGERWPADVAATDARRRLGLPEHTPGLSPAHIVSSLGNRPCA
jgi:hypothetical protein